MLTRFIRHGSLLSLWVLFSAVAAFAQAHPGEAQPLTLGQRLFAMTPMFLIVFFIFYFLVILPQKKQLQNQQALLSSLKKGESVLTSCGILGRVAAIEPDHILLEIANGVKVKFERSHIKARVEKNMEKREEKKG